MSFAKKYLELLEKYDNKTKQLEISLITEVFGKPIDSYFTPEYCINYYQWADDYNEGVCPAINGYESDNYCTLNIKSDFLLDTNSSFEQFLKDVFTKDFTDTEDKMGFHQLDTNDKRVLIGNFYLSCIETLIQQGKEEYEQLKTNSKPQSFYPRFTIQTAEDLTYYESSKCW